MNKEVTIAGHAFVLFGYMFLGWVAVDWVRRHA